MLFQINAHQDTSMIDFFEIVPMNIELQGSFKIGWWITLTEPI